MAGNTGGDAWILKLNSNGISAWQKTYGPGSFRSVQETADGGYIAADSGRVLKLNPDGTLDGPTARQKTYDGIDGISDNSIRQTFDEWGDPDGYVVAGRTGSFGAGATGFWILKLDENGEIPGCSRMYSMSMPVSDTSVESQNTSVVPQTVSTQPVDTDVTQQDTNTETFTVCFRYEQPTLEFRSPSTIQCSYMDQAGGTGIHWQVLKLYGANFGPEQGGLSCYWSVLLVGKRSLRQLL